MKFGLFLFLLRYTWSETRSGAICIQTMKHFEIRQLTPLKVGWVNLKVSKGGHIIVRTISVSFLYVQHKLLPKWSCLGECGGGGKGSGILDEGNDVEEACKIMEIQSVKKGGFSSFYFSVLFSKTFHSPPPPRINLMNERGKGRRGNLRYPQAMLSEQKFKEKFALKSQNIILK